MGGRLLTVEFWTFLIVFSFLYGAYQTIKRY